MASFFGVPTGYSGNTGIPLRIAPLSTPSNSWAWRKRPLLQERQSLAESWLLVKRAEPYLKVSSHAPAAEPISGQVGVLLALPGRGGRCSRNLISWARPGQGRPELRIQHEQLTCPPTLGPLASLGGCSLWDRKLRERCLNADSSSQPSHLSNSHQLPPWEREMLRI